MLQFALLLLGCGLSLYLWGINTTVASVMIGITSLGVVFYALIVAAGTASVSCPYRTPGARILRYILLRTPSLFHLAFRSLIDSSSSVFWVIFYRDIVRIGRVSVSDLFFLLVLVLALPFLLVRDIYRFVRTMIIGVSTLARRVYIWFRWVRSPRMDGLDQQAVALDLQCISWTLQTSLDKAVHLSTLKSLAAMTTLADFNPALVSACFDVLAGCAAVVDHKVVINQGSEELAALSDLCCLRTISHLATMDPTSIIIKDVRRRYAKTFPRTAIFDGSPSRLSFAVILDIPYSPLRDIQQEDHKLLSNERVIPVRLSRLEYQKKRHGKVPRWFLRFALHHLHQDPPPPTSVVIDCLSIIAIDMGCTVSKTATLDERYVHV